MADAVKTGNDAPQLTKEQLYKLLSQFVDAKRVNTQIDGMFAPLIARLKKDSTAKDFSLLTLFFKNAEVTEIKKHIKDGITKVMKGIKADKLIDAKITVKPIFKSEVSPAVKPVKPTTPKVESKPTKEVFGSVKSTNVVQIAGIEKLISRIDSQTEKQQSAFTSVVKTLTDVPKKGDVQAEPKKSKSTKDVLESKNAINVNVVGVDEHALKQLAKALHAKEEAKEASPSKKIEATSSWLEKLLGAIMAGFTAAKLLAAAFSDQGPLRGALKLIGDILLKASSILFRGVIGGVTRFIKLLPESILAKFGGLKDGIGKIGAMLAKSVGSITARIGGVIAKMGGTLIEVIAKVSPTLAKGVSFIGGALGKVASGFGKFLFKRLKILPFIGPFIGFGFGIKRMIDGDYVGGLAEVFGNLLAIVAEPIPPLSFAISVLTDLLLAGYDIKTGGIKNSKNSSWNKWLGDFGQALLDTGPIRWLRSIGEALGSLLVGDWQTGLAGLANAVGDIPGVGYILDLLGVKENKEGKRFIAGDFDIIGKIKDEIFKKITAVFDWAKEQLNKVRKFFGLGDTKTPEDLISQRKAEADKAFEARKKLEDNAIRAKQEQQKPYAFEASREKKLNEITAERTNLEAQVQAVAKKRTAKPIEKKSTPVTLDTEQAATESALSESDVTVEPISTEDKTEEVRRVEIEKAKESNKEVVDAIQKLQKTQEKQTLQQPVQEKKPQQSLSVVSAVSNNVKSTNEINVDTSRDNVYVSRNNIRNYLSQQRAMI